MAKQESSSGKVHRMQVVGQDHRRLDRERMPRSDVAKCSAKQSNMVGQETQSTVSQVDGKKIAAARNQIAPIAGHKQIVGATNESKQFRRKRWVSQELNPSNGLLTSNSAKGDGFRKSSTHPTGYGLPPAG